MERGVMNPLARTRCAVLTATVSMVVGGVVLGMAPIAAHAAPAGDLLSPDAAVSAEFGGQTLVLSNGNYVVVDALFDSASHTDVGAVYLYNGVTNAVISRLTG